MESMALAPPSLLRGVDLNLGKFDLTATTKVTGEAAVWGSDLQACTPVASAFWPSIDVEAATAFGADDKKFLSEVFNPVLSDRREEGDRFVPPETSFDYMQKLKALVQKEKKIQEQRKMHFFSASFVIGAANPLFPSSWTATVEIARADGLAKTVAAKARPDLLVHRASLEQTLKSVTPMFKEITEEGLIFRIYRIGSLEVRTTQEHGGKEEVGVVFSRSQTVMVAQAMQGSIDEERLVEATEYVEEGPHYYVVLETAKGNVIVTEKLEGGELAWVENPLDLEDRNSLAKVLRSESGLQATISDLKSYFQTSRAATGDSASARKRFARRAYGRAIRR